VRAVDQLEPVRQRAQLAVEPPALGGAPGDRIRPAAVRVGRNDRGAMVARRLDGRVEALLASA
jgi:hypothetical protein